MGLTRHVDKVGVIIDGLGLWLLRSSHSRNLRNSYTRRMLSDSHCKSKDKAEDLRVSSLVALVIMWR